MNEQNDLREFLQTIQILKDRIAVETNLGWTGYSSCEDLKTKIYSDIKVLQEGDMDKLFHLHILFAPTGTFQELSMANGVSAPNKLDNIFI